MHSFVYTVQSTAQVAVTVGVPGSHANDVDSALIKAPATNSATIYVGGSDVSSANGFPLAPGDPAIGIDANATDALYAICSTGSQKLNILKKFAT